jgi:hypothetical protein
MAYFTVLSNIYVGYEVLNSGYESPIFWDIILCSPLKVNQSFRGTCCLHLHEQRISQARNQWAAGSKQWRNMFLWNVGWLLVTTWRYIPEDRTLSYPLFVCNAWEKPLKAQSELVPGRIQTGYSTPQIWPRMPLLIKLLDINLQTW